MVSTVSGAIEASALVKLSVKHKNGKLRIKVVIVSINGESIGRLRNSMVGTSIESRRALRLSRSLQDISTIEYELIIEQLCNDGATDECSDSQTLANNLYSLATESMREQIDSGAFLTQLQSMAESLNVDDFFNQTVVEGSSFGALTLALLILLSSYYPDWEHQDGYCTNNSNNVPTYMENNPAWKSETLEACCRKYFSYAIGACMGNIAIQGADALLIWYPDWLGGSGACIDDTNVPEYMLQNRAAWLFSNKEACCTRYYPWAVSSCMGGDVIQGVDTSLVWYPDWLGGSNSCVDDATNVPEYMLQNRGAWMFASKEKCCTRYYGYDMAGCMGDDSIQSSFIEWYVDWKREKCVKSCPISDTDGECGGYRATWQPPFESGISCCEKLHWIPTKQCLE